MEPNFFVTNRTKNLFLQHERLIMGEIIMKDKAIQVSTWDIVVWVFVNVIIVIAIPAGIGIVRLAADVHVDYSAILSDVTLATFSVLFNLGVYIIGEIPLESLPQEALDVLQNRMAANLVESLLPGLGNIAENKLSRELKERVDLLFRKHLTPSGIKERKLALKAQQQDKEEKFKKRAEDSKRFKAFTIIVFFFVGFCGIIYGFELERRWASPLWIILILSIAIIIGAIFGISTFISTQKRE